MATKKYFEVTVWFKEITINVMAKNATEAKKKAYEKVSKKNPSKLIDRSQTNINEF